MQTHIRSTLRRTLVVTALTATAAMLLLAGTASAHIDPDPLAVQAATSNPVAFGLEHGGEEATSGTVAESTPSEPIATTVVVDDSDEDSNTGIIIGVVAVVLVIGGLGYLVSRRGAAD